MKSKIIINDGFNPELAEGAKFEGIFEFPVIRPMKKIIFPRCLVPFSERYKVDNPSEAFVAFYERDDKFADVIKNPSGYLRDLSRFAGIISPDNSLYRDMPLACQIANIYRSRLIGSYFQNHGISVIGNCRWGDERTYSRRMFSEPASFVGLPKGNIVAIGTYGCMKNKNDREYFRNGLAAMLSYLRPAVVVVYGSMPDNIFSKFEKEVNFIHFDNWISCRRVGGRIWEAE